jgi:hypothetical protein
MSKEADRLAMRMQRSRLEAEERRTRAQVFARGLARDLGQADQSLEKILGFGSTFETWRQYRLDSDIDLAMCGGNWDVLWSLLPDSEFEISLIELDLQPKAFVEQVRAQGVVLYEKQ